MAKDAHLPAYARLGLDVVGVYDVARDATDGVCERFGVGRVYAGKHVLAQKPLALDLGRARAVVEHGERAGVKVAVNQNGRWSPPWRTATLLVEAGDVGEVFGVTHLFDHDFDWIVGTPFDAIPHFVLFDFAVHWIDITRCWLDGKIPATVRAHEYRTPAQPAGSRAPLGAVVAIDYDDGSSGVIRSVGSSRTGRPGDPFWVHGTDGTIRGSIRKSSDFVELERGGEATRLPLEGDWLQDGFAGSMSELVSAIADDREPSHSARNNLGTLQLTLAACRSADEGGRPVAVDEI